MQVSQRKWGKSVRRHLGDARLQLIVKYRKHHKHFRSTCGVTATGRIRAGVMPALALHKLLAPPMDGKAKARGDRSSFMSKAAIAKRRKQNKQLDALHPSSRAQQLAKQNRSWNRF
jgi:hypothetical protein